MFGEISFLEIMLILILIIILYGKNLPGTIREFGKTVGKIKRSLEDIKDGINREVNRIDEDISRDASGLSDYKEVTELNLEVRDEKKEVEQKEDEKGELHQGETKET